MPLPRTLARWNKVGLNRVTKRVAPWTPGFGVVVHAGRRSGRRYQTPVNVFPAGGGYLLALTYGPDSDWVKNVLAAGGCELVTKGAPSAWSRRNWFTTRTGTAFVLSSGRCSG